jgi:3-hydroxybutyryl-CoA dehydrogenase
METIGVIGAGTMGNGIAQVAARSGYRVVLQDINSDLTAKGVANIEKNLSRDLEKGRITEDQRTSTLGLIEQVTDLERLHDSDIVIEAATENLDIKLKIFRSLDRLLKSSSIMASNTSSISITRLASSTTRPDRVIGMHFMNPVPVMKLVEIIRGLSTSDDTYNRVRSLSEKMGKIPLECNDSPGFVSNRVLMPMINEAIFTLHEGIATRESIDGIMEKGMNHPMGPLKLADLIGLDVCLSIMNVLFTEFGDSKYRPCPLLKKYVDAGYLGKKSGRGFYEYK